MSTIRVTEIAFICHPVTDVARARAFYEGTFGFTPSHAAEFQPGLWWIEYEIAGVAFALTNAVAPAGQSGPYAAFEVEDYDAVLAAAQAAGTISYGPMDTPVCRFFGIRDPDGNGLTIHSRKPGHTH